MKFQNLISISHKSKKLPYVLNFPIELLKMWRNNQSVVFTLICIDNGTPDACIGLSSSLVKGVRSLCYSFHEKSSGVDLSFLTCEDEDCGLLTNGENAVLKKFYTCSKCEKLKLIEFNGSCHHICFVGVTVLIFFFTFSTSSLESGPG